MRLQSRDFRTLLLPRLRTGNDLCQSGFKVESDGDFYHLLTGFNKKELSCLPSPYVWLTFSDFFCVGLFTSAWYLWYKYSDEDAASKKSSSPNGALSDPFLASIGGYDSGLANTDSPNEASQPYGNASGMA